MKNIITAISILILCLVLTQVRAQTSMFDITFSNTSEGGSTIGSGWASGSLISPGIYEVFDGSFTFSSGDGLDAGTYSLLPNPNSPNQGTSPSGYFYFDDQVSPAMDPFVNSSGMLFGSGTNEINFFSNSGNVPEYLLYENNGAKVVGDATITVVPEPSMLVFMLLSAMAFWFFTPKARNIRYSQCQKN